MPDGEETGDTQQRAQEIFSARCWRPEKGM